MEGVFTLVRCKRDFTRLFSARLLKSVRYLTQGCEPENIETMRKWRQPDGTGELKLYNSLTREKVYNVLTLLLAQCNGNFKCQY